MKARTLLLALAVAHAVPLAGCNKDEPAAQIKTLSVDDLSTLLASQSPPAVYDANGADTREKYGVVPGAKLLSSSSTFETNELPSEKSDKLVFYCGSTKCTAAEGAAKRAAVAGYTDVNVMPAGIRGWSEAGKPTDKPTNEIN